MSITTTHAKPLTEDQYPYHGGLESGIELPSRSPESAKTLQPVSDHQNSDGTLSSSRDAQSKSQLSTKSREVKLSRLRSTLIIITLAGVSFLNTMGSGLLTVALPRIATDIGLQESLLLWPASVYALAAGCLLLIFGAVADVVGAKVVWVTGSFFYVLFSLAVGLSQTGIQMIMFRTFLGIAISMCLPTAVSLTTNTFARGQWRNMAFASIGMGQPIGYSVGLVLGGVFTDTIGWRWGFYISAIINSLISVCAIWVLPSVSRFSEKPWKRRLIEDIDWIGALILSVALGILLYVLAMTTSSYHRLSDVQNILLLVVSVLGLVAFPFYMNYREKNRKPAIIPNRLWRNASFTSICIAVFFCWAAFNAFQYFSTLYFQRVLSLSALQTSIRFLPMTVVGLAVNILTGFLIARIQVRTLVVVSAILTLPASVLMATVHTDWSYWRASFWAMLLSPVHPDVLFTVSNIIISNAYPGEEQSLAGGVFNQVSQIGNSVGLAVTAAIAASVTEHSAATGADALLQGYRSVFWTVFAAMAVVVVVAFFGLKKGGLVGSKED
ncbi:MAG: hypothetical protein HETSPECPRED_009211 [Heterodermia speciosa]|uniref:Major facilitator superfamily (MFS) profile domain-containing protein n=1 Tax=Heterodermia speciosa TaxID=116794 RepID=A0A8H3G184_9LECA|nr:MAG: hypothetical protein HETSPECPRED_009211 [Heterodermia speciosa]